MSVSTSVKQERAQILKMVSEGKISAQEGARLLAAIRSPAPSALFKPSTTFRSRWLRVRVLDVASGEPRLNVSLPLSLIGVGLRLGAHFVPGLADVEEDVIAAIDEGSQGKIVEVEDMEDGERVEIFIE